MTLSLTLFPTFQLARDGSAIALKNKKAQALLVYLALTGQPQTREHLATLLWGDRFDEQARNSLRQALFALRKSVGEGVVTGDDPLVLASEALAVDDTDNPLPGFSAGADEFDTWLDRYRDALNDRANSPAQPPVHFLIAGIEDFGGGELSAYCAAELPSAIARSAQELSIMTLPLSRPHPTMTATQGTIDAEVTAAAAYGVVTGSVRQIGDKLRVSVRIEEAGTTRDFWNEVFTFAADESFATMDHIANTVWRRAQPIVANAQDPAGAIRRVRARSGDDAMFLKDLRTFIWHVFFHGHTRRKMSEFAAILEPISQEFDHNAEILCYFASATFHAAHLSDGKDRIERYREAMRINERALTIDPNYRLALMWKTTYSAWLGDFQNAEQAQALYERRYSEHYLNQGIRAVAQVMQGRTDQAIPTLERVIRAEADNINLLYRYANLALAHMLVGNDEAALTCAEQSLVVSSEFFLTHLVKIATLERLGRHSDAESALADMRRAYRDPCVSEFEFFPITDADRKSDFLNALRDAGMPK